jgi:cytochrome c biogenesis protein CcmG, thiol:disulfide interchange protein DsbE
VTKRSLIVVVGVAAVIGLLAYGLLSKGSSAVAVGQTAPDGQLQRLMPEGGDARIADYRGHWTLVNFWASWCGPCRSEAPTLERFWNQHRAQGLTVLGVNLDDNTEDALAFIHRYHLTYPQLRDGDGRSWRDRYGMTGFPESFLIDPQGRFAAIRHGVVDEQVLNQVFAPALGSAPASPKGSS